MNDHVAVHGPKRRRAAALVERAQDLRQCTPIEVLYNYSTVYAVWKSPTSRRRYGVLLIDGTERRQRERDDGLGAFFCRDRAEAESWLALTHS